MRRIDGLKLAALAAGALLVMAPDRKDPLTNFLFSLKIDGLELGTGFFRSVGGLSAETEVVDYREGGVADFTRKLPGRTKWPNLVLKRGFSADRQLWDWHQTVVAGKPVLRSGSILVYDEEGALVRTFKFKNGWPCKWEGPELDASKNEVAIETIEIAHEGIELE